MQRLWVGTNARFARGDSSDEEILADMRTSGTLDDRPRNAEYPRPLYAGYAMGVVCLAYVFGFMDRIIVGLLTPAIQADIGLTDSQMGIIQGLAFAVFYTLFGLPIGWAADRTNRKWLLTTGTAVWSIATALGVGEATLNPCTASLIGDYFEPKTRPKAFGVYVMATAFGSALTYILGGAVIALVMQDTEFSLPIVGRVAAWQAVFIIIGLGGLIPALLMAFTVREPKRQNLSKELGAAASRADTWAFIKLNRRTLICHNFGVAFVMLALYGWINWMPTFFLRIHDWEVAKFSVAYGIFGGVTGIISALSSGFVTNWFKGRGFRDGAMLTVLTGGIGLTICTVIAPLMPTPVLSLAMFATAGLVVNYAPAQALAALNEITPNQLRGLVVSIYILAIGIGGAGLGPYTVGWVTDNVFADPQAIHYSMAAVTLVMGVIGCLLLGLGLRPYRESLSRVDWEQ
ncbi:MAG: MFS transporter [Planctomycetota bacterium]